MALCAELILLSLALAAASTNVLFFSICEKTKNKWGENGDGKGPDLFFLFKGIFPVNFAGERQQKKLSILSTFINRFVIKVVVKMRFSETEGQLQRKSMPMKKNSGRAAKKEKKVALEIEQVQEKFNKQTVETIESKRITV